MRKLASIQLVKDIRPIEGADAIEVVVINGWEVVSKKGEHKVGDLVVYCEIDSFLPIREEFDFLRKSSYKKMGNQEGFRLKTIKLRGQISQGLVLPLSIIPNDDREYPILPKEGDDVTELLNITKYEPPIFAEGEKSFLGGKRKDNFPWFVPKTDEERVQNLNYERFRQMTRHHKFYVTEKFDGSSATFYLNQGEFGVCSRNIDLCETEDNRFWQMARLYSIEEKLRTMGKNVAIQGELVGPGFQGNKYKLESNELAFFNVYDIDNGKYLNFDDFVDFLEKSCLPVVTILEDEFILPETLEELLKYAEAKSSYNVHTITEREGVVIRSHDRTISFKVISNKFLLNEK